MTGLYVQLDVDFYDDPKVIAAGPLGQTLYTRALCLAKRTKNDGFIATVQLPALTIGFPGKPSKYADALVEVGLWEPCPGGWTIPAWLKRNASAAEIEAKAERKRIAGLKGNHDRWHAEKPSPDCPFCESEPSDGDRKSDRTRNPVASPEEKPEPEPEPEPEPKEKPESIVRDTGSGPPPVDNPTTTDEVLKTIVDRLQAGTPGIHNPSGWRRTVLAEKRAEHATEIARLVEQFPTAPASMIAARILGEPTPYLAQHRREPAA